MVKIIKISSLNNNNEYIHSPLCVSGSGHGRCQPNNINFIRCPHRVSTVEYIIRNDYDLYKLAEEDTKKSWRKLRKHFSMSKKDITDVQELYKEPFYSDDSDDSDDEDILDNEDLQNYYDRKKIDREEAKDFKKDLEVYQQDKKLRGDDGVWNNLTEYAVELSKGDVIELKVDLFDDNKWGYITRETKTRYYYKELSCYRRKDWGFETAYYYTRDIFDEKEKYFKKYDTSYYNYQKLSTEFNRFVVPVANLQ